jgi:ABC-type bacteriocin/lantibiotic exporter with double-glycine peptidase domain
MLALALVAAVQSGLWLDVPFVAQQKNGCGAASVAMVAEYWGRPVDPAALYRALSSPRASGAFASDLAAWFQDHGFRAFAFQAAWSDLGHHLAKGRPLIVCLRGAPLHYLVVAGLDPARRLVLVNDPARRKLLPLDEAAFRRAWYRNWALLAVPADPR